MTLYVLVVFAYLKYILLNEVVSFCFSKHPWFFFKCFIGQAIERNKRNSSDQMTSGMTAEGSKIAKTVDSA